MEALYRILRPKEKWSMRKRCLSITNAKKRIAKRAADMIQDGDTIAVDVGTTTVHIADMIRSYTRINNRNELFKCGNPL